MPEPRVVAGGTVAALVAADALAAAGAPVRLLLPRKGLGGGFAPLNLAGRVLERGLRLFELHYEGLPGEPPPLSAYEPGEAGHREHVARVAAWARELAGDDLVEAPAPAAYACGRLGPEMNLTADLEPLRYVLGDERADAVAREAAEARAALGDAGLLASEDELWSVSSSEASRRAHGPTFHATLVAPHVAKLRPEGGDDVPAALRRKVWMPLFWPRTVAEAATGGPVAFRPHRTFHTIAGGGTGRLVDLLLERVSGRHGVVVERYEKVSSVARTNGHVRLSLDGLGDVEAERPVLGLAPGELMGAAGVPWQVPRASSVLTWIAVADDDVLELPGFVHVVDADVPAFRIAPGALHADGTRTICLELAHDVTEEAAPAAARLALERCGLVREGAGLESIAYFAGPTYAEPTAAAMRAFDEARVAYLELGIRAELVGGSEAFGSDALNEQVVQGLRAAERLA